MRRPVVLALVLALPATVLAAHAPAQASPPIRQTVVFESGTEGYDTFRIPAIVRSDKGTLLAFAEGRVGGGGDTGDIDLVLRRSYDDGRTWGPLQVVGDNGVNVFGNPTPVVDPSTGDVVLLSTHNAGDATEAEIMRGEVTPEQSRRVFVQRSSDDGASWSAAQDITAATKLPEWRWYATGPVHAIALEHGEHRGRLVAAANHSTSPPPGSSDTGQEAKYYGAHSLYSDDGGLTWQLGDVDTPLTGVVNPNENTVTELADGTLYFNARDQNGTGVGTRATTTSSDGGETFDAPYALEPDIVTPVVQGSVLRLPRAGDRLVYSGPANPTARRTLQLRYSFDEGATWTGGPVLHDGPAAYSDVVVAGGRTLGVLYENGDTGTYERITFARVPFAALDRGLAPVTTTPDASGGGQDGVVGGSPEVVADGAVDAGLRLAAGDFVAVPRSSRVDVGAGPFTAAGWFRTDAAADQALLWAYNSGSGRDQWWVRLEPGANRIRALIDTSLGSGTLVAPGSFADGAWHHVALVRGDDGVALYVDGALAASAGPVAGSVTTDAAIGLHLGQRPDGANQLLGDLDDVWLLGRAAAADELAALAAGAAVGDPLVHLPLDELSR
ncbi:sialidase family protein [Jiangella sp. DSM 45060]|uniref:sialidase family protein n=1 Tax=Jiangella sp. DSM 45060 TaxID=1798224 RepID=UPI00087BE18F|nr:sialidase family protein [Jiangella sp. DSM 45060]SDS05259.1 sialidase-1 [Jiangella sp. DSM 45060]